MRFWRQITGNSQREAAADEALREARETLAIGRQAIDLRLQSARAAGDELMRLLERDASGAD